MKRFQKIFALAGAASLAFASTPLPAADHIVPATVLRQDLKAADSERRKDIARLQSLFESDRAVQAFRTGGLDPQQVSAAVASLDDASLAKLSARAAAFDKDLAAGALNNQQITYILIALGTAVVILVIVAA